MALFVVVPTHNRCAVLADCLTDLCGQTFPLTVVVSDGGSSDGTGAMIAERYPQVIYCQGTPDHWWTASTNLALREVLTRCGSDDFVLCVNDDTRFATDVVATLMAAAGNRTDMLIGCVSVDADRPEIIKDGGNRLNFYTGAFRRLNTGRALADFESGHLERVDILPGRGMLIPIRALLEVGLLPERELPHYGADNVFSARCARAGYHLFVAYDAVMFSRTDLTGKHGFRGGFSWTQLRQLFFSRRSSTNVSDRFYFAWLTRRNIPQAMLFFILSMARIVVHHLRGVVSEGSAHVPSR